MTWKQTSMYLSTDKATDKLQEKVLYSAKFSHYISYVSAIATRAVQLKEKQFQLRFRLNNRDKMIIAPRSTPFPAVRFHSSIIA